MTETSLSGSAHGERAARVRGPGSPRCENGDVVNLGPGRPRVEQRLRRGSTPRAEILDAAAELFTSNGYGSTSTRGIADAVGIRQSSLYHHFAAKDDILDALLAETIAAPLALAARLGETDEPAAGPAVCPGVVGRGSTLCVALESRSLVSAPGATRGALRLVPAAARRAAHALRTAGRGGGRRGGVGRCAFRDHLAVPHGRNRDQHSVRSRRRGRRTPARTSPTRCCACSAGLARWTRYGPRRAPSSPGSADAQDLPLAGTHDRPHP